MKTPHTAPRAMAPRLRATFASLWAALLPAAGTLAAQTAPAPAHAAPASAPQRAPVHPTSSLPVQRHGTTPAGQLTQLRAGQSGALQKQGESAVLRSPSGAAIRAQDPIGAQVRGEPGFPADGQPLRLSDPLAPPAAPQHPLAPQAGSPEAALRVRVVIRQIAAYRSGETLEIDGRLRAIDRDLRSFAQDFNYRLYQLLDEQTVELDFTKPSSLALPGLRSLEVQPTEQLKDGRLRIHLELLGPQPSRERKLHTDYSLPRGRTLLLGGYRLEPGATGAPGGTLLLAITQAE
jgi:hypothetical protein